MEKTKELSRSIELKQMVYQQLTAHGVISTFERIEVQPHYCITLNKKPYYHSIITCPTSQQKYFLKVVKGKDGAHLCNDFLKSIRSKDGTSPYPIIVVPEFEHKGTRYYVTNFLEGQTMDTLPKTTPENVWDEIADELLLRLNELEMLQAPQYSEEGIFVSDDCASILKKKIVNRLQHPLMETFPSKKLEKVFVRCCEILDVSQFSNPTLLHMDIKPANIIYNNQTGTVSLIDFESARFGDIDYGWTQILLSERNRFSEVYKTHLVPRLTRGRLTLDEALDVPKFQCYLFYQIMCNLIYYYDRNLRCPKELNTLFHQITDRLNGDYI